MAYSSILRPFSSIVAPGSLQVPNGPLVIDWTKPITRGLLGFWLPGIAMGMTDITRQTSQVLGPYSGTTGGPVPTLSNEGPGLNFTNAGTSLAFSPCPPAYLTPSAFTLYWRGLLLATSGFSAYTTILGVNYQYPTNVAPFNLWSMGLDSAGGPGMGLAWNGGGTQVAWDSGSAQTMTAQLALGIHDYCATFVVNGAVNMNVDGAFWQTKTGGWGGASQPTYTATNVLNVGIEKNAVTIAVAIWNRALGADEIMQMHIAPYDFVVPAEYDMPVTIFVAPPTLMPQGVISI